MENIDIENIWKKIDEIIKKGEINLFKIFNIIDDAEKLSKDIERNKLDKSLESLYVCVMKILEKINLIIRSKTFDKFFILETNEIIAILNYSYEWLQKNFRHNEIRYSNIYDYNFWENISFFKLIISCSDKISFAIYCLENKEMKIIRNTINLKKEQIKQINEKRRKVKFDNFINKLKIDKKSIKFFNELEIFYEKVINSTLWKISKGIRNNLEHQIVFYDNKVTNFNDFIIVNMFINLKLLWFINIKSNPITPTHIEKMLNDNDNKKLEQILKCIVDIKNKVEITNDIPQEIKLFALDLNKVLAGEKIDWSKHNLNGEIILNAMIMLANKK